MVSSEVLRILRSIERKSLTMLGALVDPEKDCKLTKDEENMKIKIEVPGGKIRTLAPLMKTRFNKSKPLHNAPMALVDVEGDFGAMVEVTGDMTPGSTLPKDRQGNDLVFTFQGAGLILYQDKDNFIRLERTAGVSLSDLHPIHKVLFEVVKDGKQVENHVYPPVPEGTVYLVLARRKGRVQCGFSQNLTSPPIPITQVEVDFAKKLKVGLAAANISAKPFIATFENFAVINSDTQLEALFGDGEIPKEKKEEKPAQ
jgi:regulation of enolase protein 1 (concanavalin A-like superfamily)